MNCIWKVDPAAPQIKTCIRRGCTNRIESEHPADRCFAKCEAPARCDHLGAELRRQQCETCGGNVQVKVFACAARGQCTLAKPLDGIACCQGCTEFANAPDISASIATVRNLIYHICPFADSDAWRKNIRQLKRRIELFNGKRCVAIATGERMAPADEVRAEFGDCGITFIEVENSPTMRERASFEPLMKLVASTAPEEATFYAHAKGGTTIGNPEGVMYWRNLMYHTLLDQFERVQSSLREAPVVGTHRLGFHVVYPDGLAASDWHFSGAFFWFRNADVFSRDWRAALAPSGWGVEAWPGRMFTIAQSRCLAMESPENPYDPSTYAPEQRFTDEGGPGESIALKIEIGGGLKPRGGGWLNVDKSEAADVRLDFDAPDFRLPFDDNSVLGVYSSHCLEHVRELRRLLREIVRVCRVGALIELKVPHWNSSMAMCHDHKQTIAEPQIDHWCNSAVEYWLGGMGKRLMLTATGYVPSGNFEEAKSLHPGWTDNQVMRFVPDACHEIHFVLHVIEGAKEDGR